MCNRYVPPEQMEIELDWQITSRNQPRWWKLGIGPHGTGPFVRRMARGAHVDRELVVGQWGLIPPFSKTPDVPYATNNARSEQLKPSFRDAWARGQRCIVPAETYDEPNWESGKNQWWRFRRADGRPWGIAGLWNDWTDPATGEVWESYTMLTLDAYHHPLLRRMHKPVRGPDKEILPLEQQDKRAIVPLAPEVMDVWLDCPVAEARTYLVLPPVEAFEHGPAGR